MPRSAALGVVGELEHVAHPLGERAGHRLGHAEDVADHAHRESAGRTRSAASPAAAGDDLVDEPFAQLAGEHLVLGDTLRAHRRQHQSAGPRVQRRVGADRRDARREQRAAGIPAGGAVGIRDHRHHGDAVARREVLDVVGDGVHVGVARRQPRPAPSIGVRHRTAVAAQLVPDAVRVRHVLRIEDVVVGRPVGHRLGDGRARRRVVAHWNSVPEIHADTCTDAQRMNKW